MAVAVFFGAQPFDSCGGALVHAAKVVVSHADPEALGDKARHQCPKLSRVAQGPNRVFPYVSRSAIRWPSSAREWMPSL